MPIKKNLAGPKVGWTKIICGAWNETGFWFRIFGYGISAVNANQFKMFSERYGYVKFIEVLGMRWRFLKP